MGIVQTIILFFLILFIHISWPLNVMADAMEIPLDKNNCNLSVPPPDSGEVNSGGELARVYPRRSKMNENYEGCQLTWIGQNKHLIKLVVHYYENGKVQLMKGVNPYDYSVTLTCIYKDNKLVSNNSWCVDIEQSISLGMGPPKGSMPPGCFKQKKQAKRDGKRIPDHCEYD